MKIFQSIPREKPDSKFLKDIDTPKDLRALDIKDLHKVSDELREYLLYSVGKTGGHFGAGLGVIELTVALHFVFNTPEDKLVWDVGHQTYPHKILTGRKDSLKTIRKSNGLAPFTTPEESEYDAFGVGHSSTSISAALGMATASRINEDEKEVVAIIGDGAMTAGMAFEALAHAGSIDENLLVILNDNQMSISNNVGGLKNYLAKISASKFYNQLREGGKTVLRFIPKAGKFVRKAEIHAKGMIAPGTLFEELGFIYVGPVNGHDSVALTKVLRNMRNIKGPKILHTITQKGRGFLPAELDPVGFHAIDKIKPLNGNEKPKKETYSKIFGDWLNFTAEHEDKLVAITPAMSEGSGMVEFSERHPEKFFDVAIAEQHSVTLAAGMASEGLKPVVAIYSTFLQRAYDQLIHDVSLQNLDVLFAIDRAGAVGADGPTHQGAFDLTFLRCIPNIIIMTPSNKKNLWKMLNFGINYEGPVAVRYPRGEAKGDNFIKDRSLIKLGKSDLIKESKEKEIAILSFGSCLELALEISAQVDATVVDMNFVKPLDEARIDELTSYRLLVTLEENSLKGGAGSAVTEYISEKGVVPRILNIGFPDNFIAHGDQENQRINAGLDKDLVVKRIKEKLN
ncbi:MAG: 1-deoxy-D-xylulose-5-phosphate synthase [Gammaproteobacteria bacterium]